MRPNRAVKNGELSLSPDKLRLPLPRRVSYKLVAGLIISRRYLEDLQKLLSRVFS